MADVQLPRVYLAGFEVFFAPEKEAEFAAAKKAICKRWGFEGVHPGDALVRGGLSDPERAREIFRKDVELMHSCAAIVANLTPFRGLSADAGTCWELGHFGGSGKPAVAYTNERRPYEARVPPDLVQPGGTTPAWDTLGMKLDMQQEPDNCMLTRSVLHLAVAPEDLAPEAQLTDLRAFEESVRALAAVFARA